MVKIDVCEDILVQIAREVEGLVFYSELGNAGLGRPMYYRRDTSRDLRSLRLVNKPFLRAATPFAFRIVRVPPTRAQNKPDYTTLLDICLGDIAPHVKTLVIAPNGKRKDFLDFLSVVLPFCFTHFVNLQIIHIDGHIFLDRSLDHGAWGWPQPNTPVPHHLRHRFFDIIRTGFSWSRLAHLTDLVLDVTILEDISRLFTANEAILPSENDSFHRVVSQLEHLSLLMKDAEQARFRNNWAQTVTQTEYPDSSYLFPFWSLLRKAKGLQSLRITNHNRLDLDNVHRSSLQRLNTLELHGVMCSCHTLLDILSPSQSSMILVCLVGVMLKNGTWDIIFNHLASLSTLLSFESSGSGYTLDGQSSTHAQKYLPPVDDPQPLLSLHFPDWDAYEAARKRFLVNREAAGLETSGY